MSDFSSDESAQTADWTPARLKREVKASLGFLTRLPVRFGDDEAVPQLASAVRGMPVVGLVVGAIAGLAGALAIGLHLPPLAAAGLAMAAACLVTGALHEDGLADVADGFWGGHSVARKLEIMKDSRIGSYGVLALVLSLLIKAAALAALTGLGAADFIALMMASAAASRALIVPVMARLANVRPGGLAANAGIPQAAGEQAALLIGLGAAFLLIAPTAGLIAALVSLAAAAGAAWAVARLARHHIGGQTGDVCGAVQQVSELAVILALAALTGPAAA